MLIALVVHGAEAVPTEYLCGPVAVAAGLDAEACCNPFNPKCFIEP